jgi:hypothetical protein
MTREVNLNCDNAAEKTARFKLARTEVDEEIANYKAKAEEECKQQEEEVRPNCML